MLTQENIARLLLDFEAPGSPEFFYGKLAPALRELLSYAASFAAIREKWEKRDWSTDEMLSLVRRVVEVTGSPETDPGHVASDARMLAAFEEAVKRSDNDWVLGKCERCQTDGVPIGKKNGYCLDCERDVADV